MLFEDPGGEEREEREGEQEGQVGVEDGGVDSFDAVDEMPVRVKDRA